MVRPNRKTSGGMMPGFDETSGLMFSHAGLEGRILAWHPLRKIGQIVDGALADLDGGFDCVSACNFDRVGGVIGIQNWLCRAFGAVDPPRRYILAIFEGGC